MLCPKIFNNTFSNCLVCIDPTFGITAHIIITVNETFYDRLGDSYKSIFMDRIRGIKFICDCVKSYQ